MTAEPTEAGATVVTSMFYNTHHAITDRVWVRMADHEIAPWVATSDNGNVICMSWDCLTASLG